MKQAATDTPTSAWIEHIRARVLAANCLAAPELDALAYKIGLALGKPGACLPFLLGMRR
ncbi:hypothetical protein M8756_14845 [Lutimaribacter sp. EGI FJ00015]|nr:hypothetical protein [Lutimaribacter sp. EGI FJ00015]MCO0637268.1 hypothetical protein [Lutimaribacter sp. EGI FJ00014]